MSRAGTMTMFWIQLRTGWRAVVAWVLALTATMVATSASISDLYGTQASIDSYADAVTSGSAMEAINGHVYGVDSLGGVIANEFGFVASVALPLMGVALVARSTRREEETGRLEVLLAGRVGRAAPLLAACGCAALALAVTSIAMGAGLLTAGVEPAGAVLYSASLGVLGLVFTTVAAVAAQVVQHSKDVYAVSLGALAVAYLLRGAGDVSDSGLTWLSPLGWAEEARPYGADPRWWPVLLSACVAVVLVAVALGLSSRRDLDAAVVHRRPGRPRASGFLRSRAGLAVALQRGGVLRWSILAVLLGATMGSLTQQAIDAFAGNEQLGTFLGSGGTAADRFLAMCALLVAILPLAYVVQAGGTLRSEETAGRLESTLSGATGRVSWLVTHVGVVLVGVVIVACCGGLALGLTAAWSTGHTDQVGRMLLAVLAYVPAAGVLAGLALALFGWVPRAYALAWLVLAATVVVALLGDPLQLPQWLQSLTPVDHVGYPPQDPADGASLAALCLVAVGLCGTALAGFRRRGVPQG